MFLETLFSRLNWKSANCAEFASPKFTFKRRQKTIFFFASKFCRIFRVHLRTHKIHSHSSRGWYNDWEENCLFCKSQASQRNDKWHKLQLLCVVSFVEENFIFDFSSWPKNFLVVVRRGKVSHIFGWCTRSMPPSTIPFPLRVKLEFISSCS